MEPEKSVRGFTLLENIGFMGTLIGAVFALLTWIYANFSTQKDFDRLEHRLIRIEEKLDRSIGGN